MDTITKAFHAVKSAAASAVSAASTSTHDPRALARELRNAHEAADDKHGRLRNEKAHLERGISEIDNRRFPTHEGAQEREKLQARLTDLLPRLAEAEAARAAAEPLPHLARRLLAAQRREQVNASDWPARRGMLTEAADRVRDNISKAEKAGERLASDHAKRRAARAEGLQRLASQIEPKRATLAQAEAEAAAEQRRQADAYAAAVRAGSELTDTEAQEEALAATQRLAARLRAQLAALESAHAADLADHERLSAEEDGAEREHANELDFVRSSLRRLRWDTAAGDFLAVAAEMPDAMPAHAKFAVPVFEPDRVPGGCLMGASDTATEHTLREMAEAMAAGCSVADVLDEIRAAGFGHLIRKG